MKNETNIMDKFAHDMQIQGLKYGIGKQIFCKQTGAILDYRNAIEFTFSKDGKTEIQIFHGKLFFMVDQVKSKLENLGYKVEVFINITKANQPRTAGKPTPPPEKKQVVEPTDPAQKDIFG